MTDRLPMKRRDFLNTAIVAAVAAPTALSAGTTEKTSAKRQPNGPDISSLVDFALEASEIERLNSVVVSSAGEVVLSKAYRGPALDRPVNVKSVSKSLVSTLVGAAMQHGAFESVKQTLGELVPELIPKGSDPRVAKLTMEDLLTMRAGLEPVSGAAYGGWVNSENWIQYALTRPFVAEPGTDMLYSTGNTHILGAVLTSWTSKSLHSLANSWLGKPLGINFEPWEQDPQGFYLGGNQMALAPKQLVKVGELYLAGGNHNGEQLLPEMWVEQAFTARTQSPLSGDGYGYGWFKRNLGGVNAAYALGYGGQLMYVVPERELVVAIMSDTSKGAQTDGYLNALHNLVEQNLV